MKIIFMTDHLHEPLIKLEDANQSLFFDSFDSLKRHPKYIEAKNKGQNIQIIDQTHQLQARPNKSLS